MTTKRQANALWDSLHDHLVNAEKVIVQIVEAKAWEPLGYDTFAEAWSDRMEGVRLATEMARVHVVYALFGEGRTPAQVRDILGSQVGDAALEKLHKQHKAGVPADLASTRVRAHERALPRPAGTIKVRVSPEEYDYYKSLAKALGRDVDDEAEKAVRAHFRRLERKTRSVA